MSPAKGYLVVMGSRRCNSILTGIIAEVAQAVRRERAVQASPGQPGIKGTEFRVHSTQYRVQSTEYRIQS